MLRIPIAELQNGMVVGKSILSAEGRILLGAGIVLNQRYIQRLKEMGIPAVDIANDFVPDLEVPEVVTQETRLSATKTVRNIMKSVKLGNNIETGKVSKAVNSLTDEIVSNKKLLINLADIRMKDEFTFGHSVNVCILSVAAGVVLGYNELRLRELGIGSLLHDIGKTKLPHHLFDQFSNFSDEEWLEYKKHPLHGYDYVRNIGDFSALAAHVAYQHHENFDGTGYPRGLKGKEILEYARIVAIADYYDLLVSDNQFRQGVPAHEAFEYLMAYSGTMFDKDFVLAFTRNVAVYPIGNVVLLNTGEVGVVVELHRDLPTRPVVKILFDAQNNRVRNDRVVDLTKDLTVFVDEVKKGSYLFEMKAKK